MLGPVVNSAPEQPAATLVLPYATSRPARGSAVWIVIAGLSVVVQCGFVYWTLQNVQWVLFGVATVQANPSAFGRTVDPAVVQTLPAFERRFLVAQGAFVVACVLVAGASAWVIASLARRQSPDRITSTCRRYARLKVVLSVAWVLAYFVSSEAERLLWVRLTRHSPVGSGPPLLSSILLLGWGLYIAKQFRDEAADRLGAR